MNETWSKQEVEVIIGSYVKKVIDFEQLVETFKSKKFTDGYVPDNTDAYVTGSWDSVEYAYYQDIFTHEQFVEIALNDMVMRDEGLP